VDEQLTDEQQAEVVRKWLRDNGAYLLGGLALGLGGLFGLNQWRGYEASQAEQASALYENVIGALQTDRVDRANEYLMILEETYNGSPYLDQARFLIARSHLDRNEFDVAASYLAQIVAESGSDGMVHIARLRLARVRLHQQQFDEAMEILQAIDSNSAFSARYHEVRGDVYIAMNRLNDARSEYQAAMGDGEQTTIVDRVYVQAKLDALGSDTAPGSESSSAELRSPEEGLAGDPAVTE
jgi:predicted negative regulator of RcsB-dependent stress response